MTNKKLKNQKGNLVVVVAIAVVALVGVIFVSSKVKTDSRMGSEPTLPPVAERTNPEPASANKVFLEKAEVGSKVTIKEVSLGNDGYVYIYRDSSGKQTLVGKTQLLKAGTHTDIVVSLSSSLKDGDVIYASLIDKSGAKVLDENKNAIEMQLNVGMAMGHYDPSEY